MKTKQAVIVLSNLTGDELFKKASEIYREEVHRIITMRSHGKKPTSNIIDGAISETNNWFRKVSKNLKWSDIDTPEKIIEYNRGDFWVKHDLIDSKLEDWGKRTRKAVSKGEFLPMLAAMKSGDLEAASSMVFANIRKSLEGYEERLKKEKEFVEKMGKRICPYGTDERFCPYSETYSMVKPPMLPTNTGDLVFACTISKCIKEA